ncbi:hypothetical protein [Nitratiruptor sp. YY09-18]|uniref:hypothetical protein n=1 Tax=Nitratiruptor sp. YY09-18 TaxID=2724901 RepID=UPI001915A203|nr:hypothetical protein [Nitratiruptor sp. YY09-18]BCD68230.1 hypothetical protein NitYY0918_C1141 [Nitratiruptor sp. YY09-18]
MERSDKEQLLESIDLKRQKGVGISELIYVLFALILALALFFPKIWLSNQIYYKSRNINKLLDDYEILKEENRLLRQKLEYERYKNQVMDAIF